jgi:hypothetical protein
LMRERWCHAISKRHAQWQTMQHSPELPNEVLDKADF